MTVVARVAERVPFSAGTDTDLDRSLALLGRPESSEQVRATALTVVLAGAAFAAMLVPVAPLAAVVSLAVGTLAGGSLLYGPGFVATAVRVRALGDGPDLVCRGVLRATLNPTPEHTAAFAATGTGVLADRLAAHVRYARGGPETAWTRFRENWRDHDPALARAVALVEAATNALTEERPELLSRALAVSLDAVEDRVTAYASDLGSLVSALYAFGVVLPLALVGLLPVAPVAGVSVPLTALAAVYNVVLPVCLVCGLAVVLARRPAAFPPARIPADHPHLADRARPALAWGVCGFVAAFALSSAVAPWALAFAVPVGVALALTRWTRPARTVRERAEALERGLPDALVVVGGRVRRGDPPERALEAAGDALSGPIADAFADASRVHRTLAVDVETAFLGRHGALDVPSPRVRSVVRVLGDALDAGPSGGRVLVSLADHVDRLVRVERETTADLAAVTNALATTGRWVAPVVAGITVALARRLHPLGGGSAYPPDLLALVVGGYVLVLAVLLPAFAVCVERGFDRVRIRHAVGVSVAVAGLVYPVTVALASVVTSV